MEEKVKQTRKSLKDVTVNVENSNNTLQVLSDLVNRSKLLSSLGMDTFGGNRDIYTALGYPKDINPSDYTNRYFRQDIAKAVIDRPVKASWKGVITIIENIKKEETPFEVKWKEIFEELQLKSIFIRADKLTGLGRYSILLLGLSDTSALENFANPVSVSGTTELLYVKPLSEQSATIKSLVTDIRDKRYGLPLMYSVQMNDTSGGGTKTSSFDVHYSRVVHLVEDILENEVYGTPRLQAIYNRLIDLEKLVGGDAEMFWRGARPGYTGTVDKDYQMTPAAFKDAQVQIDEFENNLRRILVNEGVTYKGLDQQISDPINHVEIHIMMISAVTGIPKRILVGSERGELSSAQDKQEWISYVTSRREEQNEPFILRPFIDKLIEIKILPKPKNYIIVWDKLFSLSDSEKVDMGKVRSEALKNYTADPLTSELLPLELFLEYFLAFDSTQVEEIMGQADEEAYKERALTPSEEQQLSAERAAETAKEIAKEQPSLKTKGEKEDV